MIRWTSLVARAACGASLLVADASISGCGLWCNLKGGDYRVILPPDEDETRTCVMPEDPAPDAGKACSDNEQCEKGCLCPDELAARRYQEFNEGADPAEMNERKTPVPTGRCAETWRDVGFTCHLEQGHAVLDMVLI